MPLSQHEIIISNICSKDTICYSIPIIKGIIKNDPKVLCTSDQICVTTATNTSSFKVISNNFKILTELEPGENIITLHYCCATLEISINYCPRITRFTVLPLYIICDGHDGKFQAPDTEKNDIENACKRITLISKLLQSVIAEKLHEENQGRKTFQLEDKCRVFRSRLNYTKARQMEQNELWTAIGEEIISSDLDYERIKYLGFLSCTNYCGENYQENLKHDDIVKITEGHVALGGGGLALFGTACLHTWPEDLSHVIPRFEDRTPIDKNKFMDDSSYRGTLGTCFSTTLGAVLHELCHTFDLGHTEIGIMGRGFDDIYKDFVCGAKLEQSNILKENEKSLALEEKLGVECLGRFVREKKKQEGSLDSIFFTKSCITILAHHRWLNNFQPSEKIIKFDSATKVVSSTAGLRVIELRNEKDGMVLSYWFFDGRILKYSFQIPEEELQKYACKCVLFTEDNIGNILRHVLNM